MVGARPYKKDREWLTHDHKKEEERKNRNKSKACSRNLGAVQLHTLDDCNEAGQQGNTDENPPEHAIEDTTNKSWVLGRFAKKHPCVSLSDLLSHLM
jgi:hypothetical protein